MRKNKNKPPVIFLAAKPGAKSSSFALRLQSEERRALYRLLIVMAQGERVAMDGANRQAEIAPTRSARRFLRSQARHEGFHAWVFDQACHLLSPKSIRYGDIPKELWHWQRQIRDAVRRGDFPQSVLLQQVFLEGLGQVFLKRMDLQLVLRGDHLARLRRLILGQEAKHHQFGLQLIEQLTVMDPEITDRLRRRSGELFAQAEALLFNLSESFDILDGDPVDYQNELRQAVPAWLTGAVA